jgi:hypothetical protein
LTAQVERPEIELGAFVALFRGDREQLDRPGLVARRAAVAMSEDERQPVCSFGRAAIGGSLDQTQAIAVEASFQQDRPQPCRGVGVGWRQGAQR